jgi:thiol-disulfide isomerase/thioredoxin
MMVKTLFIKPRIKRMFKIIGFFVCMKKYSFLFFLLMLTFSGFAQKDSIQPPYKRFPSFPPAKLLLPDSVSFFSQHDIKRKSPVMLMLFNPTCEHCRHETEEIIKNINAFKGKQIIMATMMPFDSMMAYREKYKLHQYKNITVVQDIHFFLPSFYDIRNLPFVAFYNKNNKLISVYEGAMPIAKALEELKK